MGQIRAIETEYDGYRFRSRLEARWAVFFDALGVDYEYEPEGFELPSGKRYLPDFRVKCYGTRGACMEPRHISPSRGLCEACVFGHGDSYAYQGECERENVTKVGANGVAEACSSFVQDKGSSFDLYIEVKGHMTQGDADRIKEFVNARQIGDTFFGVDNRVLIVGGIPPLGGSVDSALCKSYERMDGVDIYAFNYETIDGDYFAAYPTAREGHFYLMGDDSNYIDPVGKFNAECAYAKARRARFEHGETPTKESVQGRR